MHLITQLTIPRESGEAFIQLLQGDLSNIPPEHAVDILILSAFPNDYVPVHGTLIGALYEKKFSVEKIALNHKEADLREQLGCWLSEELPPQFIEQFNFRRILCFEPRSVSNKPEEVVTNVFRCLNNFIIPDVETTETRKLRSDLAIKKVAMPILAAGNQKVAKELMLTAILEAAIFWLKQGLPLSHLKLVLYNEKDIVFSEHVFNQFKTGTDLQLSKEKPTDKHIQQRGWKQKLSDRIGELIEDKITGYLLTDLYAVADDEEKKVLDRLMDKIENKPGLSLDTKLDSSSRADIDFDLFISYPHVHQKEVIEFVNAIKKEHPHLKIFFDRESIPAGRLWIRKISDAIQSSEKFIAILSPQYSASDVCWDEFQCAKLKEYNTKQSVIKTISFYEDKGLPPIMGIYSWIDCTTGDVEKLKDSVKQILK